MPTTQIKIIEAPRDAMQGIHEFIPTEKKTEYINSLLKVGFDTIDFGSFVSPKAIPQLKDTVEVLEKLVLKDTKTKLLAIVGNIRGAEDAVKYEKITYIGFPFSISEIFLERNIKSDIQSSLKQTEEIVRICKENNKIPVVYISMAFGNPYGETWNAELVEKYAKLLFERGAKIIALSDTVGKAKEEDIRNIFSTLIPKFPEVEFGLHLHTSPDNWKERLEAAYSAGCRRFDSAILGLGGCPMADDKLVGNLSTNNLLQFLENKGITTGINEEHFKIANQIAITTFPSN